MTFDFLSRNFHRGRQADAVRRVLRQALQQDVHGPAGGGVPGGAAGRQGRPQAGRLGRHRKRPLRESGSLDFWSGLVGRARLVFSGLGDCFRSRWVTEDRERICCVMVSACYHISPDSRQPLTFGRSNFALAWCA